MKYIYIIFLFLIIKLPALGQISYKDSTYGSIRKELITNFRANDSLKASFYAQEYLNKARFEENKRQIAEAYFNQIFIDPQGHRTLHLYDSIIDLTKDINKSKTALAYYNRGVYFFENRNFKKALDDYLSAIKNNEGLLKDTYDYNFNQAIAVLKLHIGENKDALKLLKKCWKYNIEQDYENTNTTSHLGVMFNLAEAYRKNQYIDTARTYTRLGIINTRGSEKKKYYYKLYLLLDGIMDSQQGKYDRAIDSLEKVNVFLKKSKLYDDLAVSNYYLGKSYLGKGNTKKAIENFKQVDSIYEIINYLIPETTESYSHLINWAKKNNNIEEQLNYINKLMVIDSVSFIRYKHLNNKISDEFDIPELFNEKETLIDKLETDKNRKSYINIFFVSISFLLLILLYFQIQKKRNLKKRFNTLIENTPSILEEKLKNSEEKVIKKGVNLPLKIELMISNKLMLFEKNKDFLNSKITIINLAKEFGTNHTYLSAFINNSKQINFSTYLKKLRVSYALERIKSDPLFREYTILAIANESGFKGAESFSKEFYKNYGVYPSYFIKKIKKIKH